MPTTRLQNGVRVDSMINWSYEFKPGLGIMASKFDTLEVNVRSFREPLKRSIQRVIAPSIGKNFLQGGRPESWEPLADQTLPVKDNAGSRYPVTDPLMRSGLLFRTMQQLNIWTITSDKASIQALPSKIWYGNVHQSGTGSAVSAKEASGGTAEGFMQMMEGVLAGEFQSERGMNIPARPFAMVQESDLDAIQAEWEIWLNERIIARLGL